MKYLFKFEGWERKLFFIIIILGVLVAFTSTLYLIKRSTLEDLTCSKDIYNCNDFKTQSEAQKVFDDCIVYGDVYQLDKNHNDIACEGLK